MLGCWISSSFCRISVVSSFNRSFSSSAFSCLSANCFKCSMILWLSVLRWTSCDKSSSSCLCFLILDLRADSLFDIILLRFRSPMISFCCVSASSEVELLLTEEGGFEKYSGMLVRKLLIWRTDIGSCMVKLVEKGDEYSSGAKYLNSGICRIMLIISDSRSGFRIPISKGGFYFVGDQGWEDKRKKSEILNFIGEAWACLPMLKKMIKIIIISFCFAPMGCVVKISGLN